jgi:mRNA interferase MazF
LRYKSKLSSFEKGVFDVQNIITIPHAKLLRRLGSLTPEQMVKVEEILLLWLGFEEDNAEEDEG